MSEVAILCSDKDHPIVPLLLLWKKEHESSNCKISLFHSAADLPGGDILFLISCSEMIGKDVRRMYRDSLVIHASDLPYGRGWSPHVWELIRGASEITVTLLEAADKVDSGRIWKKVRVSVPKSALYGEINQLLFEAELSLMTYAIREREKIKPQVQPSDVEPTYYPKRKPSDSELDLSKSLISQFNLMRVADYERYPPYVVIDGRKILFKLEAADE